MFYSYAKGVGNDIIKIEVMEEGGNISRLTKEKVDDILMSRGLKLKDDVYVLSKAKMHCIDEYGDEYSLTLDNIQDRRTVSFAKYSTRNPYTLHNLNLFIKENELECELLSTENPKSEKEKLEFRCKCGKHYFLCYNHLLINQKDTCNECGRARDSKYTPEYINSIISGLGYSLIPNTLASYRSICIQDADGYKYKVTLPNLINGTTPIKFHKLNPYTIENMKLFLFSNNYPVKLLEPDRKDIEVRTDYLKFICCDCGSEYMATWSQVVETNRFRCEKCVKKQSNLSYYVEQYLIEKGVEYIREFRFDDCRYKRALPFDFYLPSHNYVIEVNGDQHYYENPMFRQSLEERQKIDKIKEKYCIENNIGFLAIPRWWIQNKHETKRYKQEIDNIIEQG